LGIPQFQSNILNKHPKWQLANRRESVKHRRIAVTIATTITALTLTTGNASAQKPAIDPGAFHYTCNSAAPPDNDTSGGHHTITNANVRAGSSTSCVSRGIATPSRSLDYHCYTFSDIDNYSWTYVVTVGTPSIRGWIRDDLLNDYGSSVECPH
jgi:hypothetical protein